MDIKTETLSTPKRITLTVDSDELKKAKEQVYEKVKTTLPELKGFRKGKIPREIAEKEFGVDKLYKQLLDNYVAEALKRKDIVYARDFDVLGNLADNSKLTINFIAEVRPDIKLPEYSEIKADYRENFDPTEEELQKVLDKTVKEKVEYKEAEKESLENKDVAFINYQGTLKGEKEPFKGGTAKSYHLTIDTENKSFIDNFEEQMIGMKKDEKRDVTVKFPEDYRNKELAGKEAVFNVELLAIKEKIEAVLNDEFAKSKGFNDLEDFKFFLRNRMKKENERIFTNDFQSQIVGQFLLKTEFSPIPLDMINEEAEKEWARYLNRVGKTEQEILKENSNAKDEFLVSSNEKFVQVVKTNLILSAIADKEDITVTKEEVETYLRNISRAINYDEEKIERVLKKINEDQYEYALQETSARNEKVVNFLKEHFSNAAKSNSTN